MESNDSPEIPDRGGGGTSDIHGLPSGAKINKVNSVSLHTKNIFDGYRKSKFLKYTKGTQSRQNTVLGESKELYHSNTIPLVNFTLLLFNVKSNIR